MTQSLNFRSLETYRLKIRHCATYEEGNNVVYKMRSSLPIRIVCSRSTVFVQPANLACKIHIGPYYSFVPRLLLRASPCLLGFSCQRTVHSQLTISYKSIPCKTSLIPLLLVVAWEGCVPLLFCQKPGTKFVC